MTKENFGVTEESELELTRALHENLMGMLEELREFGWDKRAACVVLGKLLIMEGGTMVCAAGSIGQEKATELVSECLDKFRVEMDKKRTVSSRRN